MAGPFPALKASWRVSLEKRDRRPTRFVMHSREPMRHPGPTVHDYVTRAGLHLAKMGRRKYGGDHPTFYESFFTEKHLHQAMYDLRHRLRREAVLTALADIFEKPGNPVVLDVGCGVGDIIRALPWRCYRLGMAYSEADLRLAQLGEKGDIHFIRAAAESLPFVTDSVDAIVCLKVIEHLLDDRSAIRELTRVLKPGGRLIISVPSHYYFEDYFDLIGHYRHYSREQLVQLLIEAKLRVVKYIDPQSRINSLHYYAYVILEGLHQILNRCGVRADSMYVRYLVGSLYLRCAILLERMKTDRPQTVLASDERSTFLAVEKVT